MNREENAAGYRQGGTRRGVDNMGRGEALRDASLLEPYRIEPRRKLEKIRL